MYSLSKITNDIDLLLIAGSRSRVCDYLEELNESEAVVAVKQIVKWGKRLNELYSA